MSSFFDMRRGAGPMTVVSEVSAADLAPAIKRMSGVLERIAAEGITAEELAAAKRHRVSMILRRYETTTELTRSLADLFVYGRPADDEERRVERVRALTVDDVKRVAAKYVRPAALKIIVVGDHRALRAALASLDLGPPSVRDVLGDPAAPR